MFTEAEAELIVAGKSVASVLTMITKIKRGDQDTWGRLEQWETQLEMRREDFRQKTMKLATFFQEPT